MDGVTIVSELERSNILVRLSQSSCLTIIKRSGDYLMEFAIFL